MIHREPAYSGCAPPPSCFFYRGSPSALSARETVESPTSTRDLAARYSRNSPSVASSFEAAAARSKPVVAYTEARGVASAVRARRENAPSAVQPEHLVNEGHADAGQLRHLRRDGAVAAQGGREHPLPRIERVGFHGATSYFSVPCSPKCKML